MYNDVVTLFSHYRTKTVNRWYPTVIRNCDINIDRAKIIAKYGEKSTDSASLHFRFTVGDDGEYVSGKRYVTPKEWYRISANDMANCFTLAGGDAGDFIMLGEYDGISLSDIAVSDLPEADDIFIEDSEFVTGSYMGFFDYMNKCHDNVYAVSSVAVYSLIPHFEVTAR